MFLLQAQILGRQSRTGNVQSAKLDMNHGFSIPVDDGGSSLAVGERINDDKIRVALSLSSSNMMALDASSKAATVYSSKKDVSSEKLGGKSETHKSVVSIGSDLLDIIRRRTIDPHTFEPGSDISWSTASVGLSVGDDLEGNETDLDFPTTSQSFEEHKEDNPLIQGTSEEHATLLDIQDALEILDDVSMNPERLISEGEPVATPNDSALTKLETPQSKLSVGVIPNNEDVANKTLITKGKIEKSLYCETRCEDGEFGHDAMQAHNSCAWKQGELTTDIETEPSTKETAPSDESSQEEQSFGSSKDASVPQSLEAPESSLRSHGGETGMDDMLMSILGGDGADDLEDFEDEDLAAIDDELYENVVKARLHGSGRYSTSGVSRSASSNSRLSLGNSMVSVCDSLVRHLETKGSEFSEAFSTDRDGSDGGGSGGLSQKGISEVEGDDDEQDVTNAKCTPNRPHPALEYPLLYFLLRRFQWLFDNIKIPYAYRWRLSYPLQRNVPFSRELRKMGVHFTWGEVLLILPFYANVFAGILYTFVFPSVSISGKVARYALIAALLFAQRNSMITLLLGMPFDRSIFYHKVAGRVGGLTGLLHTAAFFMDPEFRRIHSDDMLSGAFTGSVNVSGSMIMLVIIFITLTSLPPVRRRMFEVFYYSHIISTVVLAVCTFYHSGILVPILASLIWGVDLFVRSIVMARTRYPRKANLTVISDTVIELSFPKTAAFAYNPGQYIYIAIPEISWLQWHPFSISSSPKQKVVTLHIRRLGDWTAGLYSLAEKKREVSILIEGPYGNVGVDLMGDRKYKNIMLISGGIGITPMQSLCDQLLYETVKDRRELHRLKFIWIERDPILMQEAEFIRRSSSVKSLGSLVDLEQNGGGSEEGSTAIDDLMDTDPVAGNIIQSIVDNQITQSLEVNHSTNIASQLLSLLPPGKTTDEEFDDLYASGQLSIGDLSAEASEGDPGEESRPEPKRDNSSVIDDETSFAEGSASWLFEAPTALGSLAKILDMQVYLTGRSPVTGSVPFARVGRPNIKKIFLEMKKEAIKRGDGRVAVCVSAPIKLTAMCRKACVVYSDDRVRFDFHSEEMAL